MKEVIQTPQRMARNFRRPRELVTAILGPLAGQVLESTGGDVSFQVPRQPLNRISGDCDEAATLVAAVSALGIETCFRLGGHVERETGQPNYHHVWACAFIEGLPNPNTGTFWWDLDATIRPYKAGQFAPFEAYSKWPIFRKAEEM